jgi:sarcosine oxidase subunit gamma
MPERSSALAHFSAPLPAKADAQLYEVRPRSILQVTAWPDRAPTVRDAIEDLIGVNTPPLGSAVADPNLTIAAVSPGKYLISAMTPDLAARFEAALPSADGAVTDLLHGRTILRLEGEAPALLARVVAIDLDPSVFPPGRIAQTMAHHIDLMLHRRSRTSFDLWVLRSFAEALMEWLLDAGLEIGVAFERQDRAAH